MGAKTSGFILCCQNLHIDDLEVVMQTNIAFSDPTTG